MDYGHNNWQGGPAKTGDETLRDSALRSLLLSAEPAGDGVNAVLTWDRVISLVDAAPPAKAGWLDLLLARTSRPARFAAAALGLAVVGSATLAVMPAQSDQIGTVVLSRVPNTWQAGGAELREVEAAAEQRFAALNPGSQADMYVLPLKAAAGESHPGLAFAFINVDSEVAHSVFSGLAQQYPGLETEPAQYSDIKSEVFSSRLQEVLADLRDPQRYRGLGEAQIRSQVVRELHAQGLSPDSISVERTAEGGLRISISASMDIDLNSGHAQEALNRIGLDRDLLGEQAYEQLQQALAAQ